MTASYGWPLQPFEQQHPVRGFLNDPRIIDGRSYAFHFGVDISAPDGTAVHAVAPGQVHNDDPTAIAVVSPGGRTFGYWHIHPSVRQGQAVVEGQLLGHIGAGFGHVHFAESPRPSSHYLNPLRRGALTPFEKDTHPTISAVGFRRAGVVIPNGEVHGLVDIVVDAFDTTPIGVAPPWHNMPVVPSALRWRVLREESPVTSWRSGVNLRPWRTQDAYHLVYAPATRQNHPDESGLYRFFVAHDWPSAQLPDGAYRLQVEAVDIRANLSRGATAFTIANHAPPL